MNTDYTLAPQQIALAYRQMLNHVPARKIAEACLDSSNNITLEELNRYAQGHPKINAIEHYLKSLSEQKAKEELFSDWEACLNSKGIIHSVNSFIQKWCTNPMTEAMNLMEQCSKLFDLIEQHGIPAEELSLSDMIEREWIDTCEKNDVIAYHYFTEHYTYCKYSNEAKEKILSLKEELLVDLIRRPSYYSREDMYSYISNGVLTYDDLVVNSNILKEEGFNHIIKYPHLRDESEQCPNCPLEVEMPISGNTDVLPFGTCGSGGKTSLLASLMTLFNNKEFVLHESLGAVYARFLSRHMFANSLPPATCVSCIQVISTSLRGNNAWHGVSFVEFSGEKAIDIAGDDETMFVSCNAGVDCFKLLNNANRKILLFAIDLSSNNKFQLYYSNEGDSQYVFQSDIAELWAYRLKKDKEFCKKIVAIKIVVTKKDIWNIHSSQQAINTITENGYKVFYDTIVDICHEFKIMPYNNFMPEVIPFSIGKFMPGNVYNFDDSDAKILLDSIRRDLDNNHKKKGIVNKIRKIFKY